jgi:hypothetical protein
VAHRSRHLDPAAANSFDRLLNMAHEEEQGLFRPPS